MTQPADDASRAETSVTRGSLQMLVGRVVFLFIGFLISAILSRSLGPAAFGIYGVVISVLTWCERLLGAGLVGAGAMHIATYADRQARFEQGARIMLVLWSVPIAIGLWLIAPELASYFSIEDGSTLIRIAALNLPAMSYFLAAESILSGRRHFKAQSLLQASNSGVKLVGILILLAIGVTTRGAIVAHVAATAIIAVVLFIRLPPAGPLPVRDDVVSMLRFALPAGAYIVCIAALLNMSLWQLKGSGPAADAAVGFFVASLSLTRILQMIPAAVSGVLFTSLAAAVGRGDQSSASRHIQDATRLSLGMLVPAWVLLSVDSSSVMALLFGSAYADGGILLSLLCLAFLFSALLDLWLHAISADGSVAISALVTASLVPVLWLANRYMIEAGGAIGAARATVAVFSLGALLAAGLTARKFGKVVKWLSVLRIGAAGVTIWFIGSLLPPAGPWVVAKLAVLGLVYLAVLGLSGEITKQEIVSLVQGTLGTK